MEARLTDIDRGEAMAYLGWHGAAAPTAAEADIDRCAARIMAAARPRIVWRLFALAPDGMLIGAAFRPAGRDIQALLSGCSGAILMAATLGTEVDTLIRREQVIDMAEAMMLDACGSAAIENVCDNLYADLAAAVSPRYLTDRFSPGYGDLPLSQQAELSRALDMPRRIGVTLSDSGLMIPQKTVTAIIGVSPEPVQRRRNGCDACTLARTCAFRKDGKTCEES